MLVIMPLAQKKHARRVSTGRRGAYGRGHRRAGHKQWAMDNMRMMMSDFLARFLMNDARTREVSASSRYIITSLHGLFAAKGSAHAIKTLVMMR